MKSKKPFPNGNTKITRNTEVLKNHTDLLYSPKTMKKSKNTMLTQPKLTH
jgi:hypothetical protein